MSSKSISIGHFAGLDFFIARQFWLGSAVLTGVIGLGLALFADLSPLSALLGGLLGMGLFWLADILHNLGHAIAARRTGHPMIGIRLGFLLFFGTCIYPRGEGTLPGAVHMRRALGGPILSTALGLVDIALGLLIGGTVGAWVLGFGLLNLLWYGLGSLLPLGFTDGSTLLFYWRNRP